MPEAGQPRASYGRWYILGLICLMYLITYLDRVNISTAAPAISAEFGFDEDHDGRHFQRLRVGLRAVPGSRRLAQRPLRRPPGVGGDRRLLVCHDRGNRGSDRRRVVCRPPLSVRDGRGRRLSGANSRYAALVSAAGARSRAGADPQCEPNSVPPSPPRLSC